MVRRSVLENMRVCALAGFAGLVGAPDLCLAQAGTPDSVTLTGIVRDFHERDVAGGHSDFELPNGLAGGHWAGNVARTLGADGKPVYTGNGRVVTAQWRDSKGRPIARHLFEPASPDPGVSYPYGPSMGDSAGSVGAAHAGFVESAASFSQWFRDVPGVNVSKPLSITLTRDNASGNYVFDDKTDPLYTGRGGFFPINGQLFGNSDGDDRNFHFTYELDTTFTYMAGTGQVFTFRGDDDVWVYVDGKLVIDIGGIHSAIEQTIDMDRLGWLEHGKTYELHFFFAERNRTKSNFRIETNLALETGKPPATSGLFD